jgi:hypothetical protein
VSRHIDPPDPAKGDPGTLRLATEPRTPSTEAGRDPWYPGGQRDASIWVEEYLRTYPDGCKDGDTMLGWFANAIETGAMHGAAEATAAEHERAVDACAKTVIEARAPLEAEIERLRAAAALALETIEWTQGFVVDEVEAMETWLMGTGPTVAALRAALREDQTR